MNDRKKRTEVTESVYRAVKALLRAGEKRKECAEYMNVSESTVSRIASSISWPDYKATLSANAFAASGRKIEKVSGDFVGSWNGPAITGTKVVEPKPEGRAAEMYQSNRIVEELKIQNEHLKNISAKLAFLVEKFYDDKKPETSEE